MLKDSFKTECYHTDSRISESPGSEIVITATLWSLPHAVPMQSYDRVRVKGDNAFKEKSVEF